MPKYRGELDGRLYELMRLGGRVAGKRHFIRDKQGRCTRDPSSFPGWMGLYFRDSLTGRVYSRAYFPRRHRGRPVAPLPPFMEEPPHGEWPACIPKKGKRKAPAPA